MTKQIIKANVVDDILVPCVDGETEIVVDTAQADGDVKTATISFWGEIQAVASYDESGHRVVSHMALGIHVAPNIDDSITNIISVI